MTVLELVIALVAILGAAVLFTNAIEIVGERLNLGQGAVGSVLAAVGTALPETMIPVVALIGAALAGEGRGGSAGEIGIGAILGAPFLLATLAMFVVGAAALGFRGRRRNGDEVIVDRTVARRDIGFFLPFFAIAAAAGIVQLPIFVKVIIAIVLLIAYGVHVLQTIRAGGESLSDTPDKLTLWPGGSPAPNWAVYGQVFGSLAVMAYGAHLFVGGVEHLSESAGIPASLIALVLAPLATELPEKFNSVIWLRDDKDTLAFGNITGAMVFQSTVPVSLGLLFTPWELDFLTAFSAILALASGTVLFTLLLRKTRLTSTVMMGAGSLYAVFVAVAIYQVVTR
ncbi:sodium:calcium antiporter [Rubrobacter marinus]|uniref:sodium:calcium antiporter n=1 Tax=Rubrobacter marinus TaxID=2653852 RepID=UPI00140E8CBF|nr:sodium:calcium antiporter [Rubrobacter marinus]